MRLLTGLRHALTLAAIAGATNLGLTALRALLAR